MFATLLGPLPHPPIAESGRGGRVGDDRAAELALELAVRAQEAAGLEPITDGRPAAEVAANAASPKALTDVWRATQALTDRAVKQSLAGPWSLSGGGAAGSSAATASSLARGIAELASAGCLLVEIEERFDQSGAAGDGKRDGKRDDGGAAFSSFHEALFNEIARHGGEIHLSLSLTGGTPPESWRQAILALPYSSLAMDLIHGPDSWNLVTRWPHERGVIAGVLSADGAAIADRSGEPKELLQWAASYAASTRGRGLARVGLGSAGSWANLTWEDAVARMQRLGEAARLASMPPGDPKVRQLDARAVSSRRAALGHDAPRARGRGTAR